MPKRRCVFEIIKIISMMYYNSERIFQTHLIWMKMVNLISFWNARNGAVYLK